LRTPIQPILSLSQLLLSEKIDKAHSEELLHVINRSAERLQRLVEDILDVTKIESQTLHLKTQKFDLNDLILNIISEHKNHIASQRGQRKITLTAKDDVNIEGDKGRISQVLYNLLSNAIKSTKEDDGIVISIEQKKEEGDKVVVVSVTDTGTGIHSQIFPRLFTKFASRAEGGGTGLGLYISEYYRRAWGEDLG
jgi:signal transduction histidine kinase